MKSHRDFLIDALVDAVDDWSLEQLIEWVKDDLLGTYIIMSTNELEEIYSQVFGVEELPNEIPDGYNEP